MAIVQLRYSMKVDNWLLLESLFLKDYRPRLRAFLKGVKKGMYPEAMHLLKLQAQDVKEKEGIKIDPDYSQKCMDVIVLHLKALSNRLKIFKDK
jgi:hypothetical protein